MIVYLPKVYGFCNGVKNAVDLALKQPAGTYCLGEIVHNQFVSKQLTDVGIKVVNSIDEVPSGSTLIIRAHGEPRATYDKANERSIKIVDATCPSVKRIHNKVSKYYNDGYQIVIVGNSVHPEVVGINGWCNNSAIITDGEQLIRISGADKVLVVFQTTFNTEKYDSALENILTDGVKTLEIFNTICYTTTERQNYAHLIASKSDLTIVVGDKSSSNTNKLQEIAGKYCKTVLVCDKSEIDTDLSLNKKIGLISGASTPAELVKGVLERMSENAKETVAVETVETEKVMDKNEAMLAKAVSELKDGVRYKPGQKVKCHVVMTSEDGVYVRLNNWKQDAFIPNEELTLEEDCKAFKSGLKSNDTLDCIVVSADSGKIILSKKAIDERYKDDELVEGIKAGNEFSCTMKRVGKDCLTGKLGSYTVVVHASQIKIGFVKELDKYLGKTLRLVATPDKIDDNKHVIFASQKAILLAEKKAKEDEFWNNIDVDEIVEGKVLRFAPFGAFIDVRGFDCLAHSSDLSWERINKPDEVLEIGKTYEFVVLSLDREKNRVSLGYKQLQPQPWEEAAEKFQKGAKVVGKVARILPFGAFVALDKHIDGLLHVSNVSWEWLDDINKALKVGDEIEVEVLDFDAENKRITLSRKSLLPKPEGLDEKNEQEQSDAE